MKLAHLMIAAGAATLLAGSAMAQDQAAPAPMTPDQSAAPAAPATMPPAADQSTMAPATATAPASSATLGDPAMMKAGDTAVVSNGPVPDTKENRAKYGKPMSNAGKKSSASGN